MLDLNSTSRIIGDFLEINADMFYNKQTTKHFKIIAKIKYKIQHYKLEKMAIKFKNSNFIMNKDNLIEYIAYIYNNFPPQGNYKSISSTKIKDDNYEAIFHFNDDKNRFKTCRAIISITSRDKFSVNITIQSLKGVATSCNVDVDKLYSDSKKSKEMLSILNDQIHKEMSEYIIDCLNMYK